MGRVQTGDDVKSLILRPSELRELGAGEGSFSDDATELFVERVRFDYL